MARGRRSICSRLTATRIRSSSRSLALSSVYGPRQRPDGGVVGGVPRRGGDRHRPPIAPRRRTPDPRLRVHRRRRRCARAGRRPWRRAGDQHRHGRADHGARALGADRCRVGPRRPTSARPVPTTWPGSPCRRCGPASTWRGRRGPTLDEGVARLSTRRARRVDQLIAAMRRGGECRGRSCGRRHHRRLHDAAHPGRFDRGAWRASTGSMTSAEAIGAYRRATPTTVGSWPSSTIMRAAGPLSACAADDRRHGDDPVATAARRSSTSARWRIGPIDTSGFDGAITIDVRRRRVPSGLRGERRASPTKRTAVDGDVVVQPDEVVLERDLAVFGRRDDRAKRSSDIGRMRHRDVPRAADLVGDLGQTWRLRPAGRCGTGGWRGRDRRG